MSDEKSKVTLDDIRRAVGRTYTLPHHDAGGERHWISRDCKTRVLVNVD